MTPRGERDRASGLRFFLLTFLLSWAVWLPLLLVHLGVLNVGLPTGTLVLLAFPGVLMPAVAALLLSRGVRGGGMVPLLRKLLVWRVGWAWWAFVLFVQPVVVILTALLSDVFRDGSVQAVDSSGLAVTVLFLVVASVGEELGWRGYALPHLQLRYTPLISAGVLGLAAATWHLPYWVLQDVLSDYGPLYLVLDYLFVVALTLQVTAVYNSTRGSVLLPVAFHVVFNIVNVALLPVTSSIETFALLVAFEWVVAIALIGKLRPATARQRSLAVPAG